MAPMKKSIQYILYSALCIVSLFIALLIFWWVTGKPYTVEDFATQMPHMVLVGVTGPASTGTGTGTSTGTGEIYYADIDVPMSPKWISSGISGVGELAGSYGQLYTVLSNGSVPKYGLYDSGTQTSISGGTVTKLSVDDSGAIGGTNGTSYMYSASKTAALTSIDTNTKQVSLSGGMAYSIGSDGKLYYSGSPSTATRIQISSETNWEQVSFDGSVVCAIKTDGTLWCADRNISVPVGTKDDYGSGSYITRIDTGANFTSTAIPPTGLSYISLKAGRLVAIGRDNKVYYTNSYKAPSLSWTTVSTQPYSLTTGLATGSPVTFSKIIMMYPRHNARRKRFLGSATSCNSNEEKIGNFCYQPCPVGKGVGTTCPYKARYINATASCKVGHDFINNGCYAQCPSGYINKGQSCVANPTVRGTVNKSPIVPQSYSCPANGSVSGRYVRIRPTTMLANNKLCITRLVVKDATGNDISSLSSGTGGSPSGGSRAPGGGIRKAYATDGTCIDKPVGGTSCPTVYSTYLSGSTYDRDTDTGTANRTANLYWEIDLGSIKAIKTIEFTGCSYVSASATSTTPAGTPNADQITGMRVEILYNSNSASVAPIASRTLGSSTQQTIVFNYNTRGVPASDRCYDSCPPINGVNSMDQKDGTCVSASGGITQRSVTSPKEISKPVCGPATLPDGTVYPYPILKNGVSSTLSNWVIDPSNSDYVLSCDALPGSILVPQITNINLPQPNIHPRSYEPFGKGLYVDRSSVALIPNPNRPTLRTPLNAFVGPSSIHRQSYTDSTTNAEYINTETPYVCVIPNNLVCDTNKHIVPSQRVCKLNDTMTKEITLRAAGARIGGDTIEFAPLSNIEAEYNCSQIYFNYEVTAYDSVFKVCYAGPNSSPSCTLQTGIAGACTAPKATVNLVTTLTALGYANHLYYNPKVTDGVNISRPIRQQAQCRCLKSDGTLDTTTFIYKGKCVKCSSSKDVFYPKGITTINTWEQESVNSFYLLASTSSQGSTINISDRQFENMESAKASCEVDTNCSGITRMFDRNGSAFYRMGVGPVQTYSSSSGSMYANSSSWKIKRGEPAKITSGDYAGQPVSSSDIPRAFADDYTISSAPSTRAATSMSQIIAMYDGVQDMVSYFTSMLGQASAGLSFTQNIQRPSTYYQLVGTERRLTISSSTSPLLADNGICVGPCDSINAMHEPIQMLYDQNNNRRILKGTTCHDATLVIIDKPSIPAINTPQSGDACPPAVFPGTTASPLNYAEEGSRCVQQCSYGAQTDKDGKCVQPGIPREVINPSYACPTGFKLLDTICIYPTPCESGEVLNGEYCERPTNIKEFTGTSINCRKTSYSYSSKYQGSSTSVNKWLCDSEDDLYNLLGGDTRNSDSSYLAANDIVCMADDPTTGMYYCQTVEEANNGVTDTKRSDTKAVCDNLVRAYYDLSNNLDILSNAKTNAQNASAQVAAIQITLQDVYRLLCNSGGSSTLCSKMALQLADLTTNVNSGSSAISGVLSPIQLAITSRDNLVAQMTQFQCRY